MIDPYSEFFVSYQSGVTEATLWQDAYRLRPAMLPSFIPATVAEKVCIYKIIYVTSVFRSLTPFFSSR